MRTVQTLNTKRFLHFRPQQLLPGISLRSRLLKDGVKKKQFEGLFTIYTRVLMAGPCCILLVAFTRYLVPFLAARTNEHTREKSRHSSRKATLFSCSVYTRNVVEPILVEFLVGARFQKQKQKQKTPPQPMENFSRISKPKPTKIWL